MTRIQAKEPGRDGEEIYNYCIAATGRTYLDGYGCAVIYCDNSANATIPLMKAATAMVRYAFGESGMRRRWHKDSDVARFVAALAALPDSGPIVRYRDAHGLFVTPGYGRAIPKEWQILEYPQIYGWLIEGVQLVLQAANSGCIPAKEKALCVEALKAAGHSGFC